MKLTIQQIIDYVNAGFEIEFNCSLDNLYKCIRIIDKNRGVFIEMKNARTFTDNLVKFTTDEVVSIKPRPFYPLPNGTRVMWCGEKYKILKQNSTKYTISKPNSKLNVDVFFNEIIPIQEEPKGEWEKECDAIFGTNPSLKKFIKNLLSDNKNK